MSLARMEPSFPTQKSEFIVRLMLYNQLSPEARERARENYRHSTRDDEWWDCDYEHWKEKLAELGFADAEIRHSGFSCQGDGASFTATITREFKMPDALLARIEEQTHVARAIRRFNGNHGEPDLSWSINGKVKRHTSSRHVHQNTIYAELELDHGNEIPSDLAQAIADWVTGEEKAINDEARDLSTDIYRSLESSWDSLNSDEEVERNIIEMEMDFDEDGEPQYLPAIKEAV
jgi:hypothetical protein